MNIVARMVSVFPKVNYATDNSTVRTVRTRQIATTETRVPATNLDAKEIADASLIRKDAMGCVSVPMDQMKRDVVSGILFIQILFENS